MTGWPANPKLVRHLKSTLIRTGVHVDEAVMGLSVHTNGDGAGEKPLLHYTGYRVYYSCAVRDIRLNSNTIWNKKEQKGKAKASEY